MHCIFSNEIAPIIQNVTHNNMYQYFVHKFQTNIFFYKTIWFATFSGDFCKLNLSVNLAKKWAKFTHVCELKLGRKYEPCSCVNKAFTFMFIHLCRWYILPLIIFHGLYLFLLLNQYFLKIILYNAFENVAKMLW